MTPELQVLSAMITPAVLISACGTLLFSTANRFGRAIDRFRVVTDQAERVRAGASDLSELRRPLLPDQIAELAHRLKLLRRAMTGLYLAIGLFVGASLCLGISATFALGGSWHWVPVALFLAGSFSLLISSSILIYEARLAAAATLREMDHICSHLGVSGRLPQ